MTTKRAILIAGPTASGKSAFALALAERLGGVVVNADSMQVYRELRVLTARPSQADEARAPHRLYGHVPACEAYSAGRYGVEAAEAIDAVHKEGRIPIITGGTGLYFKTLTEGLSPIPSIPEDIRRRWRTLAGEVGAIELHRFLSERDPEMASRLKPTDPQRIVRALEVFDATGRSLARWQEEPGTPIVGPEEAARFVIDIERDDVHSRCDARFRAMMDEGALDEVRSLMALGLSAELPAMRALGVAPLIQHLCGTLSRERAIEAAQAETRQYVKRQQTWLKRNMSAWKSISTQEMQRIDGNQIAFILD